MAEIRITGLLADALLHSFETGSKRRLDLNATPYVVDSLTNRGLVECDLGLTRENGYETHVLTPRGMAAREDLVRSNWGPNPKSFDTDKLDAETAPKPLYTTRNTADGVHEVVNGETGKVLRTVSTSYEARELADSYNKRITTSVEYSVKIWYRSGAYEGVAHSPEDLARKIFSDAVKSAGVESAELYGPSGKLVESKVPPTCNAANYSDRCELNTGHLGRHKDGISSWPSDPSYRAPVLPPRTA